MKTQKNIQEPSDRQTETKLVRLFSARTEQYAGKEQYAGCIK